MSSTAAQPSTYLMGGPFIPLVKIDEEQRLVYGRAAQETPDRSKEIMDYASAVPAFQKWSEDVFRESNGLSKGNVRVMHQKNVAAGKVTEISYNDAEKAIDVVAKIVDDQEWKKVMEGVYTGFSMGGGYAKRWQDGGLTRYTPSIAELSLVDRPCIPTAIIADLVKVDGQVERITLRGRAHTFAELWRPVPPAPRSFADLWKAADHDETKHPRGPDGKWVATNVGLGAGFGAISGAMSGAALGASTFGAGRGALLGAGVGALGGAAYTGIVNATSRFVADDNEDWRDHTARVAGTMGAVSGTIGGGVLGGLAGAATGYVGRWVQDKLTDYLAGKPELASKAERVNSLTDEDFELIIAALNKPLDYKAAK